ILVNFHLPEEKYLEIARFINESDPNTVRENPSRSVLTLILADGSVYPEQGVVRFVNRQVNPTTGTILLQASFPNSDRLLRPGQFAKVRGTIDNIKGGLLIPQRCVREMQGNYNVFVVNENNEVEFREIEVLSAYETRYMIVTSGLAPGERVVYEGLQKVRSGAIVNPEIQDISSSESESQDNG
ncbi:MAG: efflux RND transporter periplasmic adaptor subunit, partial [Bacteroidales bacterium]